MVSLDGSFDGSNDGNLQGLLYVDSLGYPDGKFHGSYEGIKLVCTDGKVIGTILIYLDGIILGIDVVKQLGSLDGLFNGSDDENLERLLFGGSLGYIDGKVLGYY